MKLNGFSLCTNRCSICQTSSVHTCLLDVCMVHTTGHVWSQSFASLDSHFFFFPRQYSAKVLCLRTERCAPPLFAHQMLLSRASQELCACGRVLNAANYRPGPSSSLFTSILSSSRIASSSGPRSLYYSASSRVQKLLFMRSDDSRISIADWILLSAPPPHLFFFVFFHEPKSKLPHYLSSKQKEWGNSTEIIQHAIQQIANGAAWGAKRERAAAVEMFSVSGKCERLSSILVTRAQWLTLSPSPWSASRTAVDMRPQPQRR